MCNKKKISSRHLRFPTNIFPINIFIRKSWTYRFAARIIAAHILNGSDSYQMSGSVNWLLDWKTNEAPLYDGDADIQASKYQLAHWILYSAGYSVCVANLMDLCGMDPQHYKNVDTYDEMR